MLFSSLLLDLFAKDLYLLHLSIENAPTSSLIINIDIFSARYDATLALSFKFAQFLPACQFHFGQFDLQVSDLVPIFIKTVPIASTLIFELLIEIFDQMFLRYSMIGYLNSLHHARPFNPSKILFKMVQLYQQFSLFLLDRTSQVLLILFEPSHPFDVFHSREDTELCN